MNSPPPIDFDTLREATDGTEEDLRALVRLFQDQMTQSLETLRNAIQNQSLISIQKSSHKAAGSSAVCGMKPLSEALRKLQFLEADELSQASPLFSRVEEEFKRVQDALNQTFTAD